MLFHTEFLAIVLTVSIAELYSFGFPKSIALVPVNRINLKNTLDVISELIDVLQGEFDNYEQVLEDRLEGKKTSEDGAHEHVHCSLALVDGSDLHNIIDASVFGPVIAATYYLNGKSDFVYRFRLYTFSISQEETKHRGEVVMNIWRFKREAESKLKDVDYDLNRFNRLSVNISLSDIIECISDCDIYWTKVSESCQMSDCDRPLFVGVMGLDDNGTYISSQTESGFRILVKDELQIYKDKLLVNDRGYAEDGSFVYGNRLGIPYAYKRVHIDDDALKWTLGTAHRTSELYTEKMNAIGVDSSEKNAPTKWFNRNNDKT